MAIELTPKLEEMVRRKVSQGGYASAEEVLEAALDALEQDEVEAERLREQLEQGRADIEAGRFARVSSADQVGQFFDGVRHLYSAEGR